MSGITRRFAKILSSVTVSSLTAFFTVSAQADGPGRGLTAQFEKEYLAFIIDHHYSALRMTELAAGTDEHRDMAIDNPNEGTSATPNTSATPAKAGAEQIKSMARQENRMQREEILTAQQYLQEWHGISHVPQLSPEGQQQIQLLEQAAAGPQFDQAFLETFSRHHYLALAPSQDCQVKADIQHDALIHYCEGIVRTQTRAINEMREQLCKKFNTCDYQPAPGIKGQHSSNEVIDKRYAAMSALAWPATGRGSNACFAFPLSPDIAPAGNAACRTSIVGSFSADIFTQTQGDFYGS